MRRGVVLAVVTRPKRARSPETNGQNAVSTPSTASESPNAAEKSDKELWKACFERIKAAPDERGILSRAAVELGVGRQYFHRHFHAWLLTGQVHRVNHGPDPILTRNGEEALAVWVRDSGKVFQPPTPAVVKAKAKELARLNGIDASTVGGETWFILFMKRFPDLRLRTPQELDARRMEAPTTENLKHFYEVLGGLLRVSKTIAGVILFNPARIFNVDESWVDSKGLIEKVLVALGMQAHVKKGPSPFHVSLVACGSAAGHFLPPTLIFEGAEVKDEFYTGAPDARITVSPRGYQDNATWLAWVKLFIKDTGGNCILLTDGHSTRHLAEAQLLLYEARVHLVTLPAQTTHIMQPLDVAFFRAFKAAWRAVRAEYSLRKTPIKEDTIAAAIMQAWGRATAPPAGSGPQVGVSSLKKGFEATGIFPYAPEKRLNEKYTGYADLVAAARAAAPSASGTAKLSAAVAKPPAADEEDEEDMDEEEEAEGPPDTHAGGPASGAGKPFDTSCLVDPASTIAGMRRIVASQPTRPCEILTSIENMAKKVAAFDAKAQKAAEKDERKFVKEGKKFRVGPPPQTKEEWIERATAPDAKEGPALKEAVLDTWEPDEGRGLKAKPRYNAPTADGKEVVVAGTYNLSFRREWDKRQKKDLKQKQAVIQRVKSAKGGKEKK